MISFVSVDICFTLVIHRFLLNFKNRFLLLLYEYIGIRLFLLYFYTLLYTLYYIHIVIYTLFYTHIYTLLYTLFCFQLIKDFINTTYTERFSSSPSESVIDILWATSVSIYLVGGCAGAFSAGWFADRFGR